MERYAIWRTEENKEMNRALDKCGILPYIDIHTMRISDEEKGHKNIQK